MYLIHSPYFKYYCSMLDNKKEFEEKFKNEVWYNLLVSKDLFNNYLGLTIIADRKFLNKFNNIEDLMFIKRTAIRWYFVYIPLTDEIVRLKCSLYCKKSKFHLKLNQRLQILLKHEKTKENIQTRL